MRRWMALAALFVALAAAVAWGPRGTTAQGRMGMGPGGMGPGGMHGGGWPMVRHHFYMRGGLPAAYRGLVNPLRPTADALAKGRALYDENCASCHGAGGRGDGEAGADLQPKPADLAFVATRPRLGDDFFFWSVADGGTPFETAMPPFKDVLSADDIWHVIAFLRAGLPR